MFIQKLDSSGVTDAYTVEGRAYAPIPKNRTKIRQARVSRRRTLSKQRRVAGAGAQSRRRGRMTAGLSYTMTYSTKTHTEFTSGYCTPTVSLVK